MKTNTTRTNGLFDVFRVEANQKFHKIGRIFHLFAKQDTFYNFYINKNSDCNDLIITLPCKSNSSFLKQLAFLGFVLFLGFGSGNVLGQCPTVSAGPDKALLCPGGVVLNGSIANPTRVLHSANFNSDFNGYTNSGNHNFIRAATWKNASNPTITSGGTNFVYLDTDKPSCLNGSAILRSSAFSTSGFTNATISFRHHFRQASPSDNSRIYIGYSTNGTDFTETNLTTGYTSNNNRIGAEGNFATYTAVLPPAFQNQPTVYIRFRYTYTCDWYWAFDDISVTGTAMYSWSPSTGLSATNVLTPTASPTSTQTYTLTFPGGGGCPSSSDDVIVTVGSIPGNPNVFGDNVWNIYGWNSGNGNGGNGAWSTNYSGYYVQPNLSFSTITDWGGTNNSPSSPTNYQGCTIGVDNHSWSAKRKGFPCGFYQINIDYNDDIGQLYVNGTKVWERASWSDVTANAWSGYLGANDQVEFRASEGSGGSGGAISVIGTPLTVDAGPNVAICSGGSVQLNGSASGGTPGFSYTQDFNGCSSTSCSNWTITGYGSFSNIGCSFPAPLSNLYSSTYNNQTLTSGSLATSNGYPVTLSFQQACFKWNDYYYNGIYTAMPAGSCTYTAYWSPDGTTWNAIGTTTSNLNNNICNTITLPTFSPPFGSSVRIRIVSSWGSGDFYTLIDNIALNQAAMPPTYSWSPSTGLSATNISNPIASPTSTQTYTLTATVGTCTVQDQVTVTVNPMNITGPTTVCASGQIDLNISGEWASLPTGGSGATQIGTSSEYYNRFITSGDFVLPTGVTSLGGARVLVVGGGGGGGANGGGGGGAGGFIDQNGVDIVTNSTSVTIGAGGANHTNTNTSPTTGGVSSFGALVSAGGGGGGASRDCGTGGANGGAPNVATYRAGGSGGGGGGGGSAASGCSGNAASRATAGLGTTGYTFNGGNGGNGGSSGGTDHGCRNTGGGGGGAGGSGTATSPYANNNNNLSGIGGIGKSSNITGSSATYAIGGNGAPVCVSGSTFSSYAAAPNGQANNGAIAASNTGSGSSGNGGAGGSGIVIIRYRVPKYEITGGSAATGASINSLTGVLTAGTSSGTIEIKYTSESGCTTTTTITVNPTPTAAITSANSTICHGNTVTLSGTVSSGGTVNINNGVGAATTSGTTWSTTVTPTATTTYSISTVTGGGCTGTGTGSTMVTLPSKSVNLATGGETATCHVSGSNWIDFYDNTNGNLIGSVNANGGDLGNVTFEIGTNSGGSMFACNTGSNPLYQTAYMGRNWHVNSVTYPNSANFSTPASIRLPYTTAELTAMNVTAGTTLGNPLDDNASISQIMLTKISGGSVDGNPTNDCNASILGIQQGGTANSIASAYSGTTTVGSYADFNVAQFSEMFLHKNINVSPLPVTLTNFSASCENEVTLNWTTASEQNSDKFIIEKSRDTENWVLVNEQVAAGNSNTALHYQQVDANSWSGVSYYRLRQTDFNGEQEIYGPISVLCSETGSKMTVYPNPNNGSFVVEISSAEIYTDAQLILTDITGKVITVQKLNVVNGTTQVLMNHLDLKMGTYLVSLRGGDKSMKPVKVVVRE